MPADKPLGERIRAAENEVKEWMGYRDEAKRRLDNAESGEVKRRREILEDIRKTLDEKRKRLIALRKAADRDDKVVIQSGSPHWGGSDDILRNEVVPVGEKAAIPVTSGKRTETFGNPGSDHHVSQIWASARDFGTANNYAFGVKVGDALGVDYRGAADDYKAFYISRAGRTFRVQIICGTHGTGPHTHVGIELVG